MPYQSRATDRRAARDNDPLMGGLPMTDQDPETDLNPESMLQHLASVWSELSPEQKQKFCRMTMSILNSHYSSNGGSAESDDDPDNDQAEDEDLNVRGSNGNGGAYTGGFGSNSSGTGSKGAEDRRSRRAAMDRRSRNLDGFQSRWGDLTSHISIR